MFLASWFSVPQLHRASALDKLDHPPRRQPIYSRPSLEQLEERTLLDASSGLIGGASNNLTLNSNFNLASSGNILPIPTNGSHAVLDNARGDAAATADLLAQDQPYSQFRLFGINSQGDSARFIQQSTANILRDAYGFGSGTMPNAPWMPKVYSVGLANNQFGYPSQTDMGFSNVPPWARHTAHSLPKEQNLDQTVPLDKNEDAAEKTEQMAAQRALREQEQTSPIRQDQETDDSDNELKALMEPQASQKPSPLETITQEDGSLPDSLLLSALAPVPMAALVAGLPGMAAAEEGGEVSAEAAE